MTSEESNRVREHVRIGPFTDALASRIIRLLDEREALLEFVRRFAAFAGESLESRSCNSVALEAEWQAAHAAIAKTESP